MGLDVYLYEKAAHEQNERAEAEWDALYDRKASGEITEAEYDELRKANTEYAHAVDVPSEINPKHLFNRRYLRSSYNDGGFNRVAAAVAGHDLHWIFAPLKGDSEEEWDGLLTADHIPALRECRERAKQVAKEIKGWDRLKVAEFNGPLLGTANHLWSEYPSKETVLAWGREELARESHMEGGYGTAKGEVYPKGFEILAITIGKPDYSSRGEVTMYAVFRVDDEGVEHYTQSALITAEFCDEAIALIERDQSAYMSWSG